MAKNGEQRGDIPGSMNILQIYPDVEDTGKRQMRSMGIGASLLAGDDPIDNTPRGGSIRDKDGAPGIVGSPMLKVVESDDNTKAQIRLELWSENGKPFGNVEQTFYIKIKEVDHARGDDDYLLQPYIGGGHHSDNEDTVKCDGNAYKVAIYPNGHIVHRKEIMHGDPNDTYCYDICHPSGVVFPKDGRKDPKREKGDNSFIQKEKIKLIKGDMRETWWGFKVVQILLPDNKGTRIETWIDEGADDGHGNLLIDGNKNRWRPLTQYDDLVKFTTPDGIPFNDWVVQAMEDLKNNGDRENYVNDFRTKSKYCGGCDSGTIFERGKTHPGFVRTKPFVISERKSQRIDNLVHRNANCVVLRADGHTKWELAHFSAREIQPNLELFKDPTKIGKGPGTQANVGPGDVPIPDIGDALGLLTSKGLSDIRITNLISLGMARDELLRIKPSLPQVKATLVSKVGNGSILIEDEISLNIAQNMLDLIAKALGARGLSPETSVENMPSEAE